MMRRSLHLAPGRAVLSLSRWIVGGNPTTSLRGLLNETVPFRAMHSRISNPQSERDVGELIPDIYGSQLINMTGIEVALHQNKQLFLSKDTLHVLRTVPNNELVLRSLTNSKLTDYRELSATFVIEIIRSFGSCSDPKMVLDFFNQRIGLVDGTVYHKAISSRMITALFKVISSNYSAIDDRLARSKSEVLLDSLKWHNYLVSNPHIFSDAACDTILAHSAMNMLASVNTIAAQKDKRYLTSAIGILHGILQAKSKSTIVSSSSSSNTNSGTSSELRKRYAEGLEPSEASRLYDPVIRLAGKSGDIQLAQLLHDELVGCHGNSDVACSSMMHAYESNGDYDSIIRLYATLVNSDSTCITEDDSSSGSDSNNSDSVAESNKAEEGADKNARHLFPSRHTMFHFLKACLHSKLVDSPDGCLNSLLIFTRWDQSRIRAGNELDWGICAILGHISNKQFYFPESTGLKGNEVDVEALMSQKKARAKLSALRKKQLGVSRRVALAMINSSKTIPRLAPSYVWSAAAPCFALHAKMDDLFRYCEVTEEMVASMARSLAYHSRYMEAMSLLERINSYEFDSQTYHLVLSSALVGSLSQKSEYKCKELYRTYRNSYGNFNSESLRISLEQLDQLPHHSHLVDLLKMNAN